MTQRKSDKVLVPMALVILVPVDAPDVDPDGVDLFMEEGYHYPSVCVTDSESASPYVAALSQAIADSKAAADATARLLSFSSEITQEITGARGEWTPWYGGIQFRRLEQ
jgi:hypothetical protein